MKLLTPEEYVRRVNFRKKMVRWFSVILALAIILWGFSPWVKVSFNISNSLDGFVYLIVKGADIQKGDKMAFWPPENRFYKHTWFVKIAKGIQGDVVTVKDNSFFINNAYVGYAKSIARNGFPLEASAAGEIPRGYYFVWTPHEDSFDSRYKDIGLIYEDSIIGRAYRLL